MKKEFEQKRENLEKYSNEQFDNLRQTNNKIGEKLKDEPLSDTDKIASCRLIMSFKLSFLFVDIFTKLLSYLVCVRGVVVVKVNFSFIAFKKFAGAK